MSNRTAQRAVASKHPQPEDGGFAMISPPDSVLERPSGEHRNEPGHLRGLPRALFTSDPATTWRSM